MSKDKFSDYDGTAANNEDIGGIDVRGTAKPSNFDDAFRELMAQTADNFASDTIASATTTDLGSKAAHYLTISGTTTITGLGTVKAGTLKFVRFSGALTLTHNGTSLILPGATNITTVAGDTAVFVSEGSGNWRCLDYRFNTPSPTVGWERISIHSPSSASSIDVTGLSAYRQLRISGRLKPATDDVNLFFRTSTDNGSNFDAGASDYAVLNVTITTAGLSAGAATAAAFALNGNGTGNNTNEFISFEMLAYDFNQSAYTTMIGTAHNVRPDGSYQRCENQGARSSTTARNAFRLLFSSGNIASGFVLVEGMRG